MTPRPSSALTPAPATPRPPLRTLRWAVFAVVALLLFAGLVALGTWQVQRRAWKLDLIEAGNPDWRDLYDDLAFGA